MVFIKEKQRELTLSDLKCTCGGQLELLPDDQAPTPPLALDSKLFTCKKCQHAFWAEPNDYLLDGWDEIKEFNEEMEKAAQAVVIDDYYFSIR